MSTYVPWDLIKFNKSNIERGIPKGDICPGTSLIDHAESLAMFTMRGVGVSNEDWENTIEILTEDITRELIRPYYGENRWLQ